MIEEFKKRLLKGETPDMIAQDITNRVQFEAKRKQEEIERNRIEADYIMTGLKMPKDSIPAQVAEAFIKQFEHETGLKMEKPIREKLAEARKEEKSNE